MYGTKAHEMLKELSETLDNVPPFNEEDFKNVGMELKSIYADNARDIRGFEFETDTQGSVPSVALRFNASKHIERCLLAYMHNRLRRIRKMRWEFGSILPPEVKVNLSENELDWVKNYSTLLATYMSTIGDDTGLDITQDIEPPRSFCIEVKGKENYGRYELDNGEIIVLRKDQVYLLERSQCETLVKRGILEHIA